MIGRSMFFVFSSSPNSIRRLPAHGSVDSARSRRCCRCRGIDSRYPRPSVYPPRRPSGHRHIPPELAFTLHTGTVHSPSVASSCSQQCQRPATRQRQRGAGTGYVTTAACLSVGGFAFIGVDTSWRGVVHCPRTGQDSPAHAQGCRHRESEKAGARRCRLPGAAGVESCRGCGPPLRPSLHATRDCVLLGFCTPSSRLHLVFVAFFVSTSPLNSHQ